MKKVNLNFWIDSVALIAFLLLTSTGIILHYLLPPGSGHQTVLWNMDRHEWGNIHFWLSLTFFGVLVLHLFLHWKWIFNVLKGRVQDSSGIRLGLGFLGLMTVLLLSLTPLLAPVEQKTQIEHQDLAQKKNQGNEIRGSMSLTEVSQQYQIPMSYWIQKTHLSADKLQAIRCNELVKQYGFSMFQLRQWIEEYQKD